MLALLPALSTAVPETTWVAPSVESVTGAGHVLTPDPASAHANVTVTFVLFQPLALGAGVTAAVIVGGVVSLADMTISTESDVPGRPRSSTSISLAPVRSVIGRSMRATTAPDGSRKSAGRIMPMPLSVMTPLVTPALVTCSLAGDGVVTLKLRLTVTGPPEARVNVCGPNTIVSAAGAIAAPSAIPSAATRIPRWSEPRQSIGPPKEFD